MPNKIKKSRNIKQKDCEHIKNRENYNQKNIAQIAQRVFNSSPIKKDKNLDKNNYQYPKQRHNDQTENFSSYLQNYYMQQHSSSNLQLINSSNFKSQSGILKDSKLKLKKNILKLKMQQKNSTINREENSTDIIDKQANYINNSNQLKKNWSQRSNEVNKHNNKLKQNTFNITQQFNSNQIKHNFYSSMTSIKNSSLINFNDNLPKTTQKINLTLNQKEFESFYKSTIKNCNRNNTIENIQEEIYFDKQNPTKNLKDSQISLNFSQECFTNRMAQQVE
ncbi:hypothetical protein PPERSA_08942 [Pseudocohnilembus persalinus]|uniref:Uncharacterized protein n=1 Tax=Pseudocohnilembus persalinus TaxID=266149 RepID=A0A0V0R2V0_PSEPJ|nr:hypothetical protein PPERSA_08942 [Pseudocohnilembus persalinus]|eukprot:KRX08838.1 hypothetical protein PPERSA_08942 [Pseudocohnilembus persalinus]